MFKKLELLSLGRGKEMELAHKAITTQPRDPALGHNHGRKRSFFFLGNRLLKGPALVVGGGVARGEVLSQYRCFPEPGEMVQPQTDGPEVMSTVGRNAQYSHKTQSHQHGQFWAGWLHPQPQVLSGETCKGLRRAGLRTPIGSGGESLWRGRRHGAVFSTPLEGPREGALCRKEWHQRGLIFGF